MLWKQTLGGGNVRMRKQNMSSPSPVTDGKNVWVMTGTGMLKAFDFAGKELWTRDIQKDYGKFGLNWGYASSPLLHEDSLYVQVLHGMKTDDPSYVLRIDKATGKTLWRVERPTRRAMRSRPTPTPRPRCCATASATEIVITGGDVVTGHDPATGKELWRADGLNPEQRRQLPHRGVAGGARRTDLRAVARAAAAGAQGRRPRRRHRSRTCCGVRQRARRADAGHRRQVSLLRSTTAASCAASRPRPAQQVYGPQRLRPATYSASPVLADGKIYVTNEDGVTTSCRPARSSRCWPRTTSTSTR